MKYIHFLLSLLALTSCNSIHNSESLNNFSRLNGQANNSAADYSKGLRESQKFHEASLALIREYQDCSMKRSAQLLNSSEGAREIALAASGYCQRYFDDASALHIMAEKKLGVTISPDDEYNDRKFLNDIHSIILDKLTGIIVNARASLKDSSPSPRNGTANPQTPRGNNKETPI